MTDSNPQLSQNLLAEIKNQEVKILDIDGLKIETRPNVFPPRSQFSHSSEWLFRSFGDLAGLAVLDIGTGTGIQAIQAVKWGAERVVAVDLNDEAVDCAKSNVLRNGYRDQIQVLKSDLFESIPSEKFDLIIANLPIGDFPLEGIVEAALYDPCYSLHKRFFEEAPQYLKEQGRIILSHADFKGETDFSEFEEMIRIYGLRVDKFFEEKALGYNWRLYQLVV